MTPSGPELRSTEVPQGLPDEAAPRRILVIDDNEAIHLDFCKVLGGHGVDALAGVELELFGESSDRGPVRFAVDSALQGEEGHAMVARAVRDGCPYQMAFVDMRMPSGWDGVETILQLWKADPDLEVVICTAYSDYSWDQIVARLGNTDRLLFLRKPFDDVEVLQLASALTAKWQLTRRANLRLDEMRQLVEDRTKRLTHAALHDRLTGLPNRELLLDRLTEAVRRHRRDRRKFAILFLDFDRFKVINDSLGHRAGDELLRVAAGRLLAVLRSTDGLFRTGVEPLAARLGGDEFVVLLEDLSHERDSEKVCTRLLDTLAVPYEVEGHTIHLSASIGVTTSGDGDREADAVLRDADIAMYQAKLRGKGRYVVFDESMHHEAVRRLRAENDLREALEAGQFVLHYQPIISLHSLRLAGVEALVRWRHPTGRMVPPDEFVPLAEETGSIIPLGAWVLGEACHTMGGWRRRFPGLDLTLSVNLSRRQLSSQALIATLQRALVDSGVPPTALHLEVTESTFMENREAAIARLRDIRALGVGLFLDDFGTGYSSLSCLHEFPVSGLKIDRSFVKEIAARHDRRSVVRAILALAAHLDVRVVAEGIESEAQLSLLRSFGCEFGQGYFFNRPLGSDAMLAVLDAADSSPVSGRAAGEGP